MAWKCQCICPCPLPILPSSILLPPPFLFAFPWGGCWRRKVCCDSKLNIPLTSVVTFLVFCFSWPWLLCTYLCIVLVYILFLWFFFLWIKIVTLLQSLSSSETIVSLWQNVERQCWGFWNKLSVTHAFAQQIMKSWQHTGTQTGVRDPGYSTWWLICVSPPLHPRPFMPELLFHLVTAWEERGLILACDPQVAPLSK